MTAGYESFLALHGPLDEVPLPKSSGRRSFVAAFDGVDYGMTMSAEGDRLVWGVDLSVAERFGVAASYSSELRRWKFAGVGLWCFPKPESSSRRYAVVIVDDDRSTLVSIEFAPFPTAPRLLRGSSEGAVDYEDLRAYRVADDGPRTWVFASDVREVRLRVGPGSGVSAASFDRARLAVRGTVLAARDLRVLPWRSPEGSGALVWSTVSRTALSLVFTHEEDLQARLLKLVN